MTVVNTNYIQPLYITDQTKHRTLDERTAAEFHNKSFKGREVKDILDISEDGFKNYKASLEKATTAGLQQNEDGKGIIFTDYNTIFGSKMPSIYREKDENGEYQRNYYSKEEKQQNMLNTYSDIFSEIISGYANGSRKTYIEDNNSKNGYRQLTMNEEIEALDKAFLEYSNRQSRNNNQIHEILADHANKVSQLSNGRAKIASETADLLRTDSAKNNADSVQISDEDKLKQAKEFWAKHDALYAEQMTAVMDTINDGMQVALEVAKRMSKGAKVSDSDEKMLQEYNPQMYMAAKNAQQMAERKIDMSDESLIDDFAKHHEKDRKDWVSELNNYITSMHSDGNE